MRKVTVSRESGSRTAIGVVPLRHYYGPRGDPSFRSLWQRRQPRRGEKRTLDDVPLRAGITDPTMQGFPSSRWGNHRRRGERPVLAQPPHEPITDKREPIPGAVARIRRATLAMVLVVVFCAGVAADRLVWQGGDSAGASSWLLDLPAFQTLQQTWDTIHDNYVDTAAIDDKALIYGASRGMVDALGDTGHSTFLNPEEAKLFEQATQGEFTGIGVQLDFAT